MKNLNYTPWSNHVMTAGWQWGIPELWWHNEAEVQAWNCEAIVDSQSAQRFYLTGKLNENCESGEFMLRFYWDSPVDKGYWYKLRMRFGNHKNIPDFVLYNGSIIWEKKDYDVTEGNTLSFYYYAYEDGIPCFDMIVKLDSSRHEFTLLPPHQGDYEGTNMDMMRAEGEPLAVKPKLYDYLANPVIKRCNPHKSARILYKKYQYDENPTIPPIPENAEISDVKIYEHELYPTRNNAHILSDLKMDGIIYMATKYNELASIDTFTKSMLDAGLKTLVLFPVIEKHIVDESRPEGEYAFCYVADLLEGKNHFLSLQPGTFKNVNDFIEIGIKSTCDCARMWLERCPDGDVMFVYPEHPNSLGAYTGGISTSSLSNVPGYEEVAKGGMIAYNANIRFYKEFRRRFEEKLPEYTDRISFYSHTDYGTFNQALLQSFSVEGCFGKNGNRQNGNIVMANTRGNAHSYNHDYAFVFDAWDRLYWWSHCYQGIYEGLVTILFGGCKKFTNEVPVENVSTGNITRWGEAWFDFVRFAKVHPSLGKPVVNIGVMRGIGDEWQRIASDTSSWEAETEIISMDMHRQMLEFAPTHRWRKAFNAYQVTKHVDPKDSYYNDFELLNIPFADYGHCLRTDPEKAFTGTPYGPLDFVSWNAPASAMADYKVIIYMGRGIHTSKENIQQMEEYVKNGGTLMLAVGQLRNEKDKIEVESFCGIDIGETAKLDNNLFTRLSGGKVLDTLCNTSPYIIENNFGKGKVYMLAGEFLTDFSDDKPAELITKLLDDIKIVEFSENSEHIEYCFTEFGNGYLLPLINHGRGSYPSGNGTDYGVFKSKVRVDLKKLGITENVKLSTLTMPLDGTDLPTISDYPFELTNGILEFYTETEFLSEYIISREA